MANDLIHLYDTTLRDGSQRAGISFSLQDKVRIAQRLDAFGIHFIEGGWPGSNPKDGEFFRAINEVKLEQAEICAFGSTMRAQLRDPGEDANLQALLASGTGTVTIFGKSWDLHVTLALRTTLEENLRIIEQSVAHLKKHGRRVIYDAEHFFDGYKRNPDYALATLEAAANGGADWLVLCDTNGGTLPDELCRIIDEVLPRFHLPFGVHAHDDSGVGVANSILAVRHGVRQVQGTMNGYGERCGNANLCGVIPDLVLKMGYRAVPPEKLEELTPLAHFISETANLAPWDAQPFVGRNAFAHKGGVHVSAILKNPETYEHIAPEAVGNRREVVISELSGRSNLISRARDLDLDLEGDDRAMAAILRKVKELEFEGYHFEGAEASLQLLVRREQGRYLPPFELQGFEVKVETRRDGDGFKEHAETTVHLLVGDRVHTETADGDGPVNALDNALRRCLEPLFPELERCSLLDYKVRVLEGSEGTGARVRVLIDSTDGQTTWSTIGVSSNILAASAKALTDALEYYLVRTAGKKAEQVARAEG